MAESSTIITRIGADQQAEVLRFPPAIWIARMNPPVLVVGGGLAGLVAAHRLHQAGIDFVLLEARTRLGGRILTVEAGEAVSGEGFDLGPSWFWPDIQPAMGALVRRLGLPAFEQHSDGDMLFERVRGEPPRL